jgi:hypothetical protein
MNHLILQLLKMPSIFMSKAELRPSGSSKGVDMMKRFDPRIVLGILLITGGGLALVQSMGYLENATKYFWGGAFLIGGLAFLFMLKGENWWAAFPGFILFALGVTRLLPDSLDEMGGAVFLGGIALSFWYVFLTDRVSRWWAIIPGGVLTALALLILASSLFKEFSGAIVLGGIGLTFFVVYLTNPGERWWALIPGGVLATLAGMTIAAERFGEFQTAGFFFLGLAVTFLLVAVLARMRWAYWPALALGVMGLLGLGSLLNFANYVWAVALIAIGGFMVVRYFSRSS